VREENPTIIIGKNVLLKIIEDPHKESLLKNDNIQRLLSIPNLCNKETRELIDNLLKEDPYLHLPINLESLLQILGLRNLNFKDAMVYCLNNISIEDFRETFIHFDVESHRKMSVTKSTPLSLKRLDKKEILKHEQNLLAIDEKIKKIAGFGIVVPHVLVACPKCNGLLSSKEISDKKCLICKEPLNMKNIERIPTYTVPDEIRRFWESNLWFEAYMAKMLRKLNFQTWVSVHAMGASGIMHEVDVLAIRDGTIVIAECKTGKVSRNDVFNFCTKISDLKAHVSILALIKELPDPETREFIKKNPAIIRLENMSKKKEDEIFDELEQRLSLKA